MSGSESKKARFSPEVSNILALVLAASMSGLPADLVSFPFSRLKTLQMTKMADLNSPQFRNMQDAAKFVYRTQGVKGFFRGMSPVLVSAVPGTTLFFSGAYGAKSVLGDSFIGGALSGFAGQLSGSLVWVPSEVFKELRQMEIMKPELKRMGTVQLMTHVFKTEGVRGLYRGLPAQLLTFGPFNSLGMALAPRIAGTLPSSWSDLQKALVSNFFAFSAAAVVTTPIDVVKTRLQVGAANPEVFGDRTIVSGMKHVYREAGVRGLFAGAMERACWLGTRQAIAFSTFGAAYGKVKAILDEPENTPAP
ncbi:MAG: MC/SLC25 family protein [Gammaproteobacteria bacterium]|nr:MC/SLC25 family protein [Gammaproteobacteria bacterium]